MVVLEVMDVVVEMMWEVEEVVKVVVEVVVNYSDFILRTKVVWAFRIVIIVEPQAIGTVCAKL